MGAEWPLDAEPITPVHTHPLRMAFDRAQKHMWCYYVPFLCCFSLPPGRVVLVSRRTDALCLLVQRGSHVDLLVPPLPLSERVLNEVVCAARTINGNRPTRILWADETDARQLSSAGFSIQAKDTEYLYDPRQVAAASGAPYRDLRKRLKRFRKNRDARFRALRAEDLPACSALLKHWRRRQGRKHPFLLDWGYTRAALDRYGTWPDAALQGWCIERRGQIAGFALVGPMQDGLANFFVAKTDPDVFGLSEFLRWNVYSQLTDYRLVNDAGDLGLPGLKQYKQKFRPSARLPVYSAEVRLEGVV